MLETLRETINSCADQLEHKEADHSPFCSDTLLAFDWSFPLLALSRVLQG